MLAACGPYTIVFFMIVVFFGAFYLINLMLAVVAMSYDDEAGVTNQVRYSSYRARGYLINHSFASIVEV